MVAYAKMRAVGRWEMRVPVNIRVLALRVDVG